MIKEKQLNQDLTKNISSNRCTITQGMQAISEIAVNNEIPVSIYQETVKVGGLFSSKILDCLVIFHPEHEKDYYKIVVIPGGGEVMMATTGTSKQMKKFAMAEAAKQHRKGKSLSYKIGHTVGSSIRLLGKSKSK